MKRSTYGYILKCYTLCHLNFTFEFAQLTFTNTLNSFYKDFKLDSITGYNFQLKVCLLFMIFVERYIK